MPQIGKSGKSGSVVRELLLTTIATTISIVLTFGGSAYFEQKKKKSDARLMAMMVIHDMENTALQLRQASEKIFLSSQETWKNIDNPGFIDAVQHFYVERHQIFDYINSSPLFPQAHQQRGRFPRSGEL